jgi:hypothetical protein
MTYLEAAKIRNDFLFALELADYGGKSRSKALFEAAKKYSVEKLAEAYEVLCKERAEERGVVRAAFRQLIMGKETP